MRESYWKFLKRNILWIALLAIVRLSNLGSGIDFLSLFGLGLMVILLISLIQYSFHSKDYTGLKNIEMVIKDLEKKKLLENIDRDVLARDVLEISKNIKNKDDLFNKIGELATFNKQKESIV